MYMDTVGHFGLLGMLSAELRLVFAACQSIRTTAVHSLLQVTRLLDVLCRATDEVAINSFFGYIHVHINRPQRTPVATCPVLIGADTTPRLHIHLSLFLVYADVCWPCCPWSLACWTQKKTRNKLRSLLVASAHRTAVMVGASLHCNQSLLFSSWIDWRWM